MDTARMAKKHSEADKLLCSFCQEPADLNLSLEHRVCGGRTHTECLPAGQKPNYKLCSQCTGEYVPLAMVVSMDTAPPSGAAAGREPFPADGVDYVLHPGVWVQESPSTLKAITGLFSRTAPPPQDVRSSQDPHFLIRNRVPVRDMLRYNKLGLQHLLKAGVTMSELLANDYTWNDLLLYEDVGRKGPTRAKQTLAKGLKTTANHFRDYPDALPFAKVSAHTQMCPSDLRREFGLNFPVVVDKETGDVQYGSLQCHGDEKWTARDCVRLGLKMDDLSSFGITLLQQYEDLLIGLSPAEATAAERELCATREHLDALLDINEVAVAAAPAPVAEAAVTPSPEPIQPPSPVLVQQQPPSPPRTQVHEPAPEPAVIYQQPQIYVVRAPPTEEPVYEIPVAASRPVVRDIHRPKVIAAPVFKTPTNRFDRHGAILAPVRRGK